MDERNVIPDQSGPTDSREIVLRYAIPEPQPIVERYVRTLPLGQYTAPSSELPSAGKRNRRRWLILLCMAVVLSAVVASIFFLFRRAQRAAITETYHFEWKELETASKTTIPLYTNGADVRLFYNRMHGAALSIQEVYARVNPCTVTVAAALPDGSAIIGTGVIFTDDGYILTNAHVIEGGQSCVVVLSNGRSYDSKLVGYDMEKDLAVIKIDASSLPTAEFGDADELSVGDTVYAIGNPLGVRLRGTLTDGIVSAINRDVVVDGVRMTLIQTNAALNNGNSGGPLINVYGQVVGINTMKMGSSSTVSVEGLGFAIPVSSTAWMVNDLIAYGEIRSEPILGISLLLQGVTLSDGKSALEIGLVEPESPGDEAGLEPGDRVLSADGEALESVGDLLCQRRRHLAGEVMTLEVERRGRRFSVDVTLTASDD